MAWEVPSRGDNPAGGMAVFRMGAGVSPALFTSVPLIGKIAAGSGNTVGRPGGVAMFRSAGSASEVLFTSAVFAVFWENVLLFVSGWGLVNCATISGRRLYSSGLVNGSTLKAA